MDDRPWLRPATNAGTGAIGRLEHDVGDVPARRRLGLTYWEWLRRAVDAGWTHLAQDGWARHPVAWFDVREALLAEERGAARAPTRGGPDTPAGSVAWREHLEAYAVYRERFGDGLSPEIWAERGGFSRAELAVYLGREPDTWEPARAGALAPRRGPAPARGGVEAGEEVGPPPVAVVPLVQAGLAEADGRAVAPGDIHEPDVPAAAVAPGRGLGLLLGGRRPPGEGDPPPLAAGDHVGLDAREVGEEPRVRVRLPSGGAHGGSVPRAEAAGDRKGGRS